MSCFGTIETLTSSQWTTSFIFIVTFTHSKLLLSVYNKTRLQLQYIHLILKITTMIYMEIFSRRKIKTTMMYYCQLKVDRCRLCYAVYQYYAHGIEFRELWTWNERKNINKSSLWRFLLLFQSEFDIAIVLYFYMHSAGLFLLI